MNKLAQTLLRIGANTNNNVGTRRFLTSRVITPAKLCYSEYKNSERSIGAPPFVIIHGLMESKHNWKSLCKTYAEKTDPSRRILAIDLRNHGESEYTEEHSNEHTVEDLRHFLQENNIDRVSLMGYSIGGKLVMSFAFKYPELVEKLIVLDMSPTKTYIRKEQLKVFLYSLLQAEMPRDVPLSKARRLVQPQLAKYVNDPNIVDFLLTNLKSDGNSGFKWQVNVPVLLKSIDEITTWPDVTGKRYDGHTLFIGGDRSQYLSRSYFPKIQELFPNAELIIFENVGHWIHAERPQELLKLTMEFLAKNPF